MVIGLIGYAGSGKDTAADAIAFGYNPGGAPYRKIGFADELKAECTTRLRRTILTVAHRLDSHYTRMQDNEVIALLLQLKPDWFRALLQEYGTEVRRADDEDYWVRMVSTRLRLTPIRERNFVISDVRFPNEVRMVRFFEGKIVRISNPRIEGPQHDHSSEIGIADIVEDYVLHNDCALHEFQSRAITLLTEIEAWQRANKS